MKLIECLVRHALDHTPAWKEEVSQTSRRAESPAYGNGSSDKLEEKDMPQFTPALEF